jgi:hypothetical protein
MALVVALISSPLAGVPAGAALQIRAPLSASFSAAFSPTQPSSYNHKCRVSFSIEFRMALRRLFGGRVSGLALVTAALLFFFLTVQFRTRYDGRVGLGVASEPPEVEIVVASQTSEDTSWVAKYLPGWARSIYVTNDPRARLTVPKNKGREAMVYLT